MSEERNVVVDNWYLDEQLWRDFYDCMFSPEDFQQADEQIESLLQMVGYMPDRVLDLASGPGRHSLPLAERGCHVTAVDSSAFLLSQLRARLRDELAVETVRKDMREFARPGSFDLITSMWTSFGYFDSEQDNLDLLTRCFDNLDDNGVLIIDTVGKEYLLRELQPVHCREYDSGRLLIERPVLNEAMTRIHIQWLLIDGDTVKRKEFSHSIYSGVELQDRLNAAGFRDVVLYGDWQAGAYDIDAERLIAVARK